MTANVKSEFTVKNAYRYNQSSAVRWILTHIWRYKWLFIAALILSVIDFFAYSQSPVLVGKAAEEILNPTGWVLLGFLSDPRTGLGRFRDFRISNYQLMEELINHCRNMSIEEILEQPDVKERVEMYFEQTRLFTEMIGEHTRTDGNVIVTDLRGVAPIYTGNRFLVYSLYPDQNVSLWVVDGKQKQNVAIACGYSILNRTCDADIGALMLSYGGGGHRMVGTCQVPYEDADRVIEELILALKGRR